MLQFLIGKKEKDEEPEVITPPPKIKDPEKSLMDVYGENKGIKDEVMGSADEDTKKSMWLQLAKFGAGLAAQPGGDLVGAIGKAAEKPLEGAGEVVKDVSTAKRQAKLLALQTAISENKPGSIGTALKDIAKAYNFKGKDKLEKAAAIYEKWQTRNTTAVAADVSAYRKFADHSRADSSIASHAPNSDKSHTPPPVSSIRSIDASQLALLGSTHLIDLYRSNSL